VWIIHRGPLVPEFKRAFLKRAGGWDAEASQAVERFSATGLCHLSLFVVASASKIALRRVMALNLAVTSQSFRHRK
jgi:hypothetical protein